MFRQTLKYFSVEYRNFFDSLNWKKIHEVDDDISVFDISDDDISWWRHKRFCSEPTSHLRKNQNKEHEILYGLKFLGRFWLPLVLTLREYKLLY